MNKVLKTKFEDMDGCYVANSACLKDHKIDEMRTSMTFVYVHSDNLIVEWEPKHGPITLIEKCERDWSNEYSSAQKHWLIGWCKGYGNWAQLAVDELRLKENYIEGNFRYVFDCLKRYAE